MTTRMPSDTERRAAISAEASRVEESTRYSAQGQFEAAKVWRTVNWILGGATSCASGVAGVLTFATEGLQVLAGALALTAAATAAVHATLRPEKRSERAEVSANEYLAIQGAARRFLNVDVPYEEPAGLRTYLDELARRAEAVNKSSDSIPGFAYRRAQGNLERGGQTYGADT